MKPNLMLGPDYFSERSCTFELEPLQAHTADTYIALFRDVSTMQHIGAPLASDTAKQNAKRAIALSNQAASVQCFLHIMALPEEQPAGIFSLYVPPQCNAIEIGIMLFNEYHRSGLAAAVIKNVCIKLLKRYSDFSVMCKIDAENQAAINRAISLGFYRTDIKNLYQLDKHIFEQLQWGDK